MVIIQELEVSNCFSIKNLFLRFENKSYAALFNHTNSNTLKSKLILVIQSFLFKSFMKTPLEQAPDISRKQCNIRIKFIIPKDKNKNESCVEAMRTAQNPNYVYYFFNGEQYVDHIRAFHERCQIDITELFPILNDIFRNENRNLMHVWITTQGPLSSGTEESYELFADYLDINQPLSGQQDLEKLANSVLIIDKEFELLKKRMFVDVANETGRIFNYITFEKYIVKFFVPLAGKNPKLKELEWDDMDLNTVETFIQKTNGENSVLWNKAEPGLKCLLKIAQLIALAKHLGQKCIILEDTLLLQDYQNQETIKEAILNEDGINRISNWESKNFLQQIVSICNKMEITLFMNYQDGLPLPPKGANIIQCQDSLDTNSESVCVSWDMNSMSLIDYIHQIVH